MAAGVVDVDKFEAAGLEGCRGETCGGVTEVVGGCVVGICGCGGGEAGGGSRTGVGLEERYAYLQLYWKKW